MEGRLLSLKVWGYEDLTEAVLCVDTIIERASSAQRLEAPRLQRKVLEEVTLSPSSDLRNLHFSLSTYKSEKDTATLYNPLNRQKSSFHRRF